MTNYNRIRIARPPYSDPSDYIELTAFGRAYSDSTELISREDRASDGTLRRDVIASKKTFTLEYSDIGDAELEILDDLYVLYVGSVLYLEVAHGDTVTTYSVFIRPFSRKRVSILNGGLWSGVTVEFVEV